MLVQGGTSLSLALTPWLLLPPFGSRVGGSLFTPLFLLSSVFIRGRVALLLLVCRLCWQRFASDRTAAAGWQGCWAE